MTLEKATKVVEAIYSDISGGPAGSLKPSIHTQEPPRPAQAAQGGYPAREGSCTVTVGAATGQQLGELLGLANKLGVSMNLLNGHIVFA